MASSGLTYAYINELLERLGFKVIWNWNNYIAEGLVLIYEETKTKEEK